MRPKHEVGQIIRDWGKEFFDSYSTVSQVRKSFQAMALCRTSLLGGHVEVCPECGEVHVSYNSCRDRHCPKCQHKERETWIEMRREEVIPGVKYFHVVFTIPDCFHPLAMANQAMFYTCMFRTAWATLRKFFSKQGLQGGMTSILHTWGSNLFYHPHIHCIVTGGGVDRDGAWHHLKGCKGNRNFLFPVHALSKVFRAKMLAALTKELATTETAIPKDVRKAAMSKDWVMFSRPPAKGVNQVLDYIGRYAYRVAISNSRIRNVTAEGMVTYDCKDYRNGGKLEGDDHACQRVPEPALPAHPASRLRADPPLWIALPIQPRKSAASTDPTWRDTCPQRAEEETLYADMRRERMEYRYMPEL